MLWAGEWGGAIRGRLRVVKGLSRPVRNPREVRELQM